MYAKPAYLQELEDHILSQFERIQTRVLGTDFCADLEQRFRQQGLPTNKHEDWHYYKVNELLTTQFQAALAYRSPRLQAMVINSQPAIEIDMAKQQVLGQLPAGVVIEFQTPSTRLKNLNRQLLELSGQDATLMISQRLAEQLVVIKVADGVCLSKPIVIYLSETTEDHQFYAAQIQLSLGKNAQAELVEIQAGGHSQAILASSVFVELAENAHCRHYSFAAKKAQAASLWHGLTNIQRNACYESISLLKSQRLSRRFQAIQLVEEGARAEVKSAYTGSQKQILDSRTQMRHLAPNCFSQQLHQGLLDGQSRGNFSGIIYVDPVALKTDGQMDNGVLLLSDQAQNNSKPQLEIYADDVKCSHGFTCGRMDQNQLFYMQSRGIPLPLAKQQLINAFLAKVTSNLPSYIELS